MTFFKEVIKVRSPNTYFSLPLSSSRPSPSSFSFPPSVPSSSLSNPPLSFKSTNLLPISAISSTNACPVSKRFLLGTDSKFASSRFSSYTHFQERQQKGNSNGRNPKVFGFFKNFGKPSKAPEIVQAGDPVLHESASEVPLQDIGSPEIEKIIEDMISTMRAAPGVGFAAPQIGFPLRIIVLEDTEEYMSYSTPELSKKQRREPFPLMVVINPKLSPIGEKSANFFEGCLSVSGYRGMVKRHLAVELTGLDRQGNKVNFRAEGWQARILQHECDHLEGTLYVDKIIPKTFRSEKNLPLPVARGCPEIGECEN